MTAHRHGGWIKHQTLTRRSSHALIGESETTVITKAHPKAAIDSWWTRPVPSREAFDQLAAARSREAGWRGASSQEAK